MLFHWVGLELSWIHQLILATAVITIGLHVLVEKTVPKEANQRLEDRGRHKRCSFCGKSSSRSCSSCKAASYCSALCQHEHWKYVHKYECSKRDIGTDHQKGELSMAKRVLEEEQERVQRLELELEEIQKNYIRKSEETRIAQRRRIQILKSEPAKLKRELEEMRKLIHEKDVEQQLARRQIEEISQALADARQDAEHARQDANSAENEWMKVKRELEEKRERVTLLELECQDIRESSTRQDEEKGLELANALNASAIAEDGWVKVKEELQEMLELVQLLKLECEETRQNATREVEEKEQELANALDALDAHNAAAQDCAICLTNEKDMAFGCGHMTCEECGSMLSTCPICREQIACRIKLYR